MNNQDIFHVISSQILVALCDEFPAPVYLSKETYIGTLANRPELWDLQTKLSNAESLLSIQPHLGGEGLSSEGTAKAQTAIRELKLKEKEKQRSIKNLEAVWKGTLLFLEAEGFIRHFEEEGHQFTAKGFVNLNRKIIDGQSSSLLSGLREAVRPQNLVTTLTNGALATLFPMVLGG